MITVAIILRYCIIELIFDNFLKMLLGLGLSLACVKRGRASQALGSTPKKRLKLLHIFDTVVKAIWSHRLMVRTPGFHPDNPGSIPGGITKAKSSDIHVWAFYFIRIYSQGNRIRRVRYCPVAAATT